MSEGDILRAVVAHGRVRAERDDMTFQAFGEIGPVLDVRIDDQISVIRQTSGKFPERRADIVQILEEIQMIRAHIQNDGRGREERQKAIGVLAGLGDEDVRLSDPDVAADGVENTADGKRRIRAGCHQDLGNHGSRGCLAMRAGHIDGIAVLLHHGAEKLGAGRHRNAGGKGCLEFRVVRVNRRCVDDEIRSRFNIFRCLRIVNAASHLLELLRER